MLAEHLGLRLRRTRQVVGSNAPFWGGALVVTALTLAPLSYLIFTSFQLGHPASPQGWTSVHYLTVLRDSLTYKALFNTVMISAVGTFFTVTIALAMAWLIERTDMPLRELCWTLILIPLAMPGILFAIAWTQLLAPKTGLINLVLRQALSFFGIELAEGPFNIYSLGGMIWADALRGVTTVFLLIVGSMRLMNSELEEAARVNRANTWITLRRISIPLLAPALFAAGMYSFISSMDSFEIPLAIGLPGNIFVMSTLIYFRARLVAPIDYGMSAVYAVLFMLIMLILIYFYHRLIRQQERFAVVTGKGFRPRPVQLGKWRHAAFSLFAIYFMLSTLVPFLVLLYGSLLPTYRVPSLEALSLISLRNYREIFEDPNFLSVIKNTVVLMIITATITAVLALLVSWIVLRTRAWGRHVLDNITFVSFAIPGIVIGLAFIFLFVRPPLRYTGLYGTLWVVALALTTQYLAFCTRTTNAGLLRIHKELEEAAYVARAGRLRTIWKVTLPLVLPAFVAAWVWAAVTAMRAFSVPIMLASRDSKVISLTIWGWWDDGMITLAMAGGVLLIVMLAIITAASRRLLATTFAGRG